MTDFNVLLQQGQAWLFVPSAIALGALHGLEPGHSKTMMAAFIVAVRGTVGQAVLLGLSATLSHTAVVWAIALAGMYFGQRWQGEAIEPYFQLLSGVLILVVAAWMAWRTLRNQSTCGHDHSDDHGHDHTNTHAHDDHGHEHGQACDHGHAHGRDHAHHHKPKAQPRKATTGQIVMFGITGGLMPCPASISVLLVCLQLKKFALGMALVLCFSVGLAATLVSAGAVAAMGARHATSRWSGFSALAQRAPLISAVVIGLVGVFVSVQGWRALA